MPLININDCNANGIRDMEPDGCCEIYPIGAYPKPPWYIRCKWLMIRLVDWAFRISWSPYKAYKDPKEPFYTKLYPMLSDGGIKDFTETTVINRVDTSYSRLTFRHEPFIGFVNSEQSLINKKYFKET